MITDGSHPSHMDPDPAQTPSSTALQSTTQQPWVERDLGQTSSTSAQRWVLALTAVASLMVMLDTMVVTTALSTIRVHLGASIEEREWTVNAYTLSFAVLLMTAAALGDRFGRRRL